MAHRGKVAGNLPASPRKRLALESLERRLLLSGDVAVVVSGGDLVITGDTLDNDISITQGVTADEFVVTGNATTVNGGALATLGVSLAKELTDQIINKVQVSANIASIRAQDDMLGEILDVKR